MKTIRGKIVKSYIKFVTKSSSLSCETILEYFKKAVENQKKVKNDLSDGEKEELIKKLNIKTVFFYEQIDPPLVLFNIIPIGDEYKKKCTILISNKKINNENYEDEKFKELNEFYKVYLKSEHKLFYLEKMAEFHIFLNLCSIFLTSNSIFKEVKENL